MWNQFDTGMSTDGGYMDESRMDTTIDDEKKGRRADNLVPVMIGHLINSGPELKMHGLTVRVVSVVARINSIDQVTTKVTYVIQDETGTKLEIIFSLCPSRDSCILCFPLQEEKILSLQFRKEFEKEDEKLIYCLFNLIRRFTFFCVPGTIKAIKWNSAEDEADSREQEFKVGSYVHVFGLPREQDGEKHILVLRVFKLREINELTCHLLEVFYVCQMGFHKQNPTMKQIGGTADNRSANTESYDFPGMDRDQSHVFHIIKNDISDSGIERDEIKAKVPSHIVSKIDDILEFLAGEGHIYTTRTDNHFKAT